jgi:hypothetical protein
LDNCEHLIDACASQELGDKVGIAYSLLGLAGIAAKRGEAAWRGARESR